MVRSTPIISQAKVEDASAISHLLAHVWREAYQGIFPDHFLARIQNEDWTDGFKKALIDPFATTLVAEQDGEIIGMIGFGKARDSQWQHATEIYALNVLPNYQHQNIGTALINHCLESLEPKDQKAYLKVACKNLIAQKCYAKVGLHNTQQQIERQIADFAFQEWIFAR